MRWVAQVGPAAAILIPYVFFEWLRNSTYDLYYAAPHSHFYIVSAVAILSMMIGVAVGMAGNRLRSIKVSFLSLSFISLAGVFSVHGLATPGFLHQTTQLPGFAAQLSILLATVWLWMSSLPSDHPVVEWLSRWQKSLVPVWTAVIVIVCTIMMIDPHAMDQIPIKSGPFQTIVTATILLLNAFTLYSYFQSYRYSKFPLQLAIVYSSGWFIVSQLIMARGQLWYLSWWMYHFLLLGSMIVMVAGFMKQYGTSRSWMKTIHALYTTDPVQRITDCLSPSVQALIAATESKDPYTAGHNFRVTMYALRIAEEMGLAPEQCRALVTGTIIHDVGKIQIPDSILNKPGRLTEEERSVIEQHPAAGYEMCRKLGFRKEELGIIRFHHERWDGLGYPDRLKGEDIPLLARIVAVADIYDAVTSDRAYRKAWSHEEAMSLLQSQKGTHLDPSCVDAWVHLCEREPHVYRQKLQYAPSSSEASHSFVV